MATSWANMKGTSPSTRVTRPCMPKTRRGGPAFTWQDDRSPILAVEQDIIYEAHVPAWTIRHPDVPEHLRGTYLGNRVQNPVVDHLLGPGREAIELMPVHQFVADPSD